MPPPLFDPALLAQRRARALRRDGSFLLDHLVADLAERVSLEQRRFETGLLVGIPPDRAIADFAVAVDVVAPDRAFELAASDRLYDLIVVAGVLDSVDELPLLLTILRHRLAPDGVFLAAFPGNDSLPMLRQAIIRAEQEATGRAVSRFHPRIAAASVSGLLTDAGFSAVVVDVDRMRVRYRRLDDLVADLRDAGATAALAREGACPLTRSTVRHAREVFAALGDSSGTVETIEIVNSIGRAPSCS